MKTTVIIPAGGLGKRIGGNLPKQFIEIGGVPIMARTAGIFQEMDEIDSIVISVHSEWYTYTKEMIAKYGLTKVREVVVGGKDRQDSVANALITNTVKESELVLTHDAVRPFVTRELIKALVESAEEYGAVIPVTKPTDTIKEVSNRGTINKTLDRSKLCMVQTPQAFWTDIIINAYQKASSASYRATDCAGLVEFIGYKVFSIPGEETNIKISTPLDLKIAEFMLKEGLAGK